MGPLLVAGALATALATAVAVPVGAQTTTTPATTTPSSTSTPSTTPPPSTTVPGSPPPVATPAGALGWSPLGRQVFGRPVLQTTHVGPAYVAWMDPQLVRPAVVPGTGDPGGPWPWGGQVAPDQQRYLVAAFNGGFKFGDSDGAVIAFGHSYRAPVPDEASFVVYADGSFTVGQWNRDVDHAKQVVAVRQNLHLLVDGGAPVPAASSPGNWGGSVLGPATMRSAVGVDANGALVWAGGRMTPLDLANTLVKAGAVRAMELDINPDWVNFNSYDVGPDGVAHGNGVFGATGSDRYLHPNGRDFIAVFVRATVQVGASDKIGVPALSATATIR